MNISDSRGLLPQATSRISTPYAKTSVVFDAFPVRANSGEMYPIVPTTLVVCDIWSWSYNLARPKSLSRAFMLISINILLGLTSRWITTCSHSSCKYNNPPATPLRMLILCSQFSTKLSFGW
ncbi:hypothetical protein IC582_009653 [Cucumis melo]